ncbi:hypothetical protein AK830_g3363 [Neonectria ditissima]|uniref:CENP-V/GFA domain-containing protein n=1 Tax=Neonectria ditissima TaxID=78410 RepID=A0A0P7BQQ4_9HYPO|nr:hypothetical protein AK830_g3363 [Neonectria ditissima]
MSKEDVASIHDTPKQHIPLAGCASDGWSTEDEATATCFCGAVQLSFPTSGPGLMESLICHCTDCRKITASMFASLFIIVDTHLKHRRGQEKLTVFSQSQTIPSGDTVSNYFCSTCGSLMYRKSTAFPGASALRIGTVDDFHLHETKLKPRVEQFTHNRVAWLRQLDGVKQAERSAFS